jgi:DNA polymerase
VDILFLDTETYSEADLLAVGLPNYRDHPSSEVTLFTGAFNQGLVFSQDFAGGDTLSDPLKNKLIDPNVLKVAWNAKFDRTMLEMHTGMTLPAEQWEDAMVLAYSLGLPGKLETCGEALGLNEDDRKMRDGRRLINKFAKTHRGERKYTRLTDPEDWSRFITYAVQDTATLRILYNMMKSYTKYTLPKSERYLELLDGRINERGIPIDLGYAHKAVALDSTYKTLRLAEAVKITGLDNPISPQQLQRWLFERDVDLPNMQKHTLEQALKKKGIKADVAEAIKVRLELGKSSTSKYQSMINRTSNDGMLRDQFQYYGAHTGRWAGRGVQVHNLPQGNIQAPNVLAAIKLMQETIMPLVTAGDHEMLTLLYGNLGNVLSSTIRPTIAAPPGKVFLVVDYSSIETAVIAWLANCKTLLDLMWAGGDPYKDFATQVFNVGYDAVTKSERKFAKPAVLGCVYGLGAVGYQGYAAGYGVVLNEKRSQDVVDTFRARYHEVKRWWYALKAGFTEVVRGTPAMVMDSGQHVEWFKDDDQYLFCKLPSGRSLAYPKPAVKVVEHPEWGLVDQMGYMGMKNHQWVDVNTHPGKIAENITQAVARDLLGEGMKTAMNAGFDVVMHVHDEVIALVDEDKAEDLLPEFTNCLVAKPAWAEGIPLRADGYISPVYMKD